MKTLLKILFNLIFFNTSGAYIKKSVTEFLGRFLETLYFGMKNLGKQTYKADLPSRLKMVKRFVGYYQTRLACGSTKGAKRGRAAPG